MEHESLNVKTAGLVEKVAKFEADKDGFVDFGDVAHWLLDQQTQYASRYVDGKIAGYPALGEGLRIKGDTDNYHSLKIHRDDIVEFVSRVKRYKGEVV